MSVTAEPMQEATGAGPGLWLNPLGEAFYGSQCTASLAMGAFALMLALRLAVGRAGPALSTILYVVFTSTLGLWLASALGTGASADLTRVLALASLSLAATSAFGLLAKRSLGGLGSFLLIASIGLSGILGLAILMPLHDIEHVAASITAMLAFAAYLGTTRDVSNGSMSLPC